MPIDVMNRSAAHGLPLIEQAGICSRVIQRQGAAQLLQSRAPAATRRFKRAFSFQVIHPRRPVTFIAVSLRSFACSVKDFNCD